MRIEIGSIQNATNTLAALMAALLVTGCSLEASSGSKPNTGGAPDSPLPAAVLDEDPLPHWVSGSQPVLRHRKDAERGRLWILTAGGVEAYDIDSRAKVAQSAIPGWVWADEPYGCASPELVLGPKGEALISSNVLPRLWRVDPVNFAVSEHELTVDTDVDKEIGFSAMTYSAQQGVYFAVSNFHGSLWRIDPLLRRAQSIPLSSPVPNVCASALQVRTARPYGARLAGLCVRRVQHGRTAEWALKFAPDQRSAYVHAGACTG